MILLGPSEEVSITTTSGTTLETSTLAITSTVPTPSTTTTAAEAEIGVLDLFFLMALHLDPP